MHISYRFSLYKYIARKTSHGSRFLVSIKWSCLALYCCPLPEGDKAKTCSTLFLRALRCKKHVVCFRVGAHMHVLRWWYKETTRRHTDI